MVRVDLLLVAQGLAPSRTAAQHMVEAGRVAIDDGVRLLPVAKVSQKLAESARLVVAPDPSDRFVCRGGLKMAGALGKSALDVRGLRALDIGQSTGGFTDCLLQEGALRVVGVDVGHGQLAARLAADPRVRYFEGVNGRALDREALFAANDGLPFDVIVCDVSFISLTLVLPSALPLLAPGGYLLSLVKPQFEVGREGLGKGGIVKDPRWYDRVRDKIGALLADEGMTLLDWFDSPILGGDGNREFFVFARRDGS
ncbi:TlyA family RNA methyltransferase [Paludibacterium paludis]|uniref:TlyA family rRNA (Cytidine-2'-O)-methyltransferase n=1 Tax=Paludibacterium paludis TaxID=1225769 RepID=A0A918NZP3_9NEIS|nr:TlyA family RNA methyltransferase [Paludibacterium paludis]GGY09502.1 TlyA family rRNA (cytidine-2'-O)-methyltransferase [Paludibacterium paludis]